jgi:tRNA threonylcarbamoyladenosine biosynthesis protein TsaB
MREVYFATYARDGDHWRAEIAPCVLAPGDIAAAAGRWFGAGNAFAAYPEIAARLELAGHDPDIVPSAVAIGTLARPRFAGGEGVAASEAAPFYVRHRVALTSAERDSGRTL